MNKLIVVTGGTKGIGRAIIEKFSSHGFDVATCSRNQKDLDSLKVWLQELNNTTSTFIQRADMADKEAVNVFCEFVKKLNRPVDVLVNNAGYFLPGEIITEPEGTLENMINANVYSAYYTTRGIVPQMKLNRRGHIFNMCSIASFMAYPNGGSYAISKFALLGFSKCLRQELMEFGIRVTAVMPGATKTASWDGVDIPEERFIKVEDVADTIYAAYALSDRSVVEELIIRPQLGDL